MTIDKIKLRERIAMNKIKDKIKLKEQSLKIKMKKKEKLQLLKKKEKKLSSSKNRQKLKALKTRNRIKALKEKWIQENMSNCDLEQIKEKAIKSEYQKAYRKEYKLKNLASIKERTWKKLGINLTYNEFLEMYKTQDGKCAICGIPMNLHKVEDDLNNSKTARVDHDHSTGKIRSLLCNHCNVGLGAFNDHIPSFQKAISYIEFHQSSSP